MLSRSTLLNAIVACLVAAYIVVAIPQHWSPSDFLYGVDQTTLANISGSLEVFSLHQVESATGHGKKVAVQLTSIRPSILFLIMDMEGLKRVDSWWATSEMRSLCGSCFRFFMTRTIQACHLYSAFLLQRHIERSRLGQHSPRPYAFSPRRPFLGFPLFPWCSPLY